MPRTPLLRIGFFTVLALGSLGQSLIAQEKGSVALARVIDELIDRQLKAKKLKPAPLTDDVEFMRRVYLDLSGRVPTAKQAEAFLTSKDREKRAKLIDELLASPQYGEQFGRVWRDWIAPAELPSEGNGGNQPIAATQNLGKWLGQRFGEGEPWDAIVRKMLTVEGNLKQKPEVIFYSLIGDDQGRPQPAGSARTIASLFLGVQLQCAECHDDPFKHWKQTDFWGMAAFFRNINYKFAGRYFDQIGETFAESEGGRGQQPKRDKTPNGAIVIPREAFKNSGQLVPAAFVDRQKYEAKELQPLRPVFTDWLVDRSNPYFAKAFVNRTWGYFFARGFVMPIDDMRDDNPPSHPELLQQLTDDFLASGYDVKHLVKAIVSSKAYQRTSRPTKDQNAETIAWFGRMPVRVMSADVLYDSLKLALNDPNLDLRAYDARDAGRFGESSPVGTAYEEFVKLFATNEEDSTDLTHGIPQYLTMINHPRLRTGGRIADELVKTKAPVESAIETLYLGTLSRRPSAEELNEAKQFLSRVADDRRGYSGLLWTLVNRSEFLLVR